MTDSESKTPESAEMLENGLSPSLEKEKTFLEKHLFGIIFGISILVLLVSVLQAYLSVCFTHECFTLVHNLHTFVDESVDPCNDFYKYTCGNYDKLENQYLNKKIIVAGFIKEYLVKTEFTQSKSEQAMKIFYDKCVESRTLKDQNNNSIHEEANYHSIYRKIKEMGGWPLMGDEQWDANQFDLNKLLVQSAHSTETDGEIDMGMFSFQVLGARKLNIVFKSESDIDESYVTLENFKKLCELNGVHFNEQLIKDSLNRLISVKESFRKLVTTTVPPYYKTVIPFPELQRDINEIDFGYIIENVQRSNKNFLGNILRGTTTKNLPPFSDKFRLLDHLILQTTKEDLANWLIYSYFTAAIGKLSYFENHNRACEFVVMHFLPDASLRVFVQNYFKKENMKPVSDLVEDTKKSATEILEATYWIDERTRQTAIKKVRNMEKLIGYPEDIEAQGALDETFHLNITENTVPFELLSKLEERSIRLLMGYAASETNFDPATLNLDTNAHYSLQGNRITMLVSYMGAPFFDISYPKYAKIASLGFVLGHEIGHGFDGQGMNYDENANARGWLTPEDITKYLERAICFVMQYEAYDDPDFGKNLNGKTTVNENIADDFGIDVAWRTFKNSNPSGELHLPGLQNYDVNKLFFQIFASNWCSPPATHSLEKQLKDPHATPSFRINGVLANFKPFAETFNCPVGSPMNPVEKCDLF